MIDCSEHGIQTKWGSQCCICFQVDIARWGSD